MKVRTFFKAAALATAAVMVLATGVLADNVNALVETNLLGDKERTINQGDTTNVTYKLVATNDDSSPGAECNASAGTPVSVTIASSPASGLTISPNPVVFTNCSNDGISVSFTGNSAGTYALSASASGGSPTGFNTQPANWTLHVQGAACTNDYTMDFQPPIDDSTSGNLVLNTMKYGRVVPVKATIFDNCANAYVDGNSGKIVTLGVNGASGTTGAATDGVEAYSDAGNSNAGTNQFRWSLDGFWIYNLDTKNPPGVAMTINNVYRADVKVDGALASDDEWALLKPVK